MADGAIPFAFSPKRPVSRTLKHQAYRPATRTTQRHREVVHERADGVVAHQAAYHMHRAVGTAKANGDHATTPSTQRARPRFVAWSAALLHRGRDQAPTRERKPAFSAPSATSSLHGMHRRSRLRMSGGHFRDLASHFRNCSPQLACDLRYRRTGAQPNSKDFKLGGRPLRLSVCTFHCQLAFRESPLTSSPYQSRSSTLRSTPGTFRIPCRCSCANATKEDAMRTFVMTLAAAVVAATAVPLMNGIASAQVDVDVRVGPPGVKIEEPRRPDVVIEEPRRPGVVIQETEGRKR